MMGPNHRDPRNLMKWRIQEIQFDYGLAHFPFESCKVIGQQVCERTWVAFDLEDLREVIVKLKPGFIVEYIEACLIDSIAGADGAAQPLPHCF